MTKKPSPIVLNKNDPESLYNWIAYKISCPEFRNPIKNFIDENCSTFIDIEENSFEQGQLFNEMNLLVENLLKEVLEEGQITQEDFLKAAERGLEDKKYKKYFTQIINFGNYTFFKSIMTKRNYQIIQMAEKQMNQENEKKKGNEGTGISPEVVAQMLENEQNEINEAIKQSLADEDEKRRIAVIEEEEMRRAIKQSIEQSKNEQREKQKQKQKKEEPKREEHKKVEPKKEEPKKEEPKKFVPNIISNNVNFQYSGELNPEENKSNPTIISSNKGYQYQAGSKAEEFGGINESKNKIHESTMPAPLSQIPEKKEEKNVKNNNIINEPIKEEKILKKNENIINEPKKEERITRDFVNIFEEKKLTLAPLVHKVNLQNPYKATTLKEQLEKNQKGNVQKDIERMNKKAEMKNESAKEVIKNSLKQNAMNKNNIINMEDNENLLIDEDEGEVAAQNDKKGNSKSKNINFGRIAIPKDFNDKITDYDKKKQEELKEYREYVIKMKKDEREQNKNN